jgi:hypothetical protein
MLKLTFVTLEAKQMIDQQTSAENQSQIHTESSQQSAEQNSNAQTVSLLDSLLTDSSITQDALDSIEKDEIHNSKHQSYEHCTNVYRLDSYPRCSHGHSY